MEDSMQLIDSIGSIARFLLALPALWISGRIVVRNYAGQYRSFFVILWLALAGLILTPMIDFFGYLGNLVGMFIPPSGRFDIPIFLGVAPGWYFTLVALLLGASVYGLTIFSIHKFLYPGKLPFLQGVKITNWEFGFVLLGIAGLVNQMVRGIVINFVFIYFPSLIDQFDITQHFIGFWITWGIALILLAVTYFLMTEMLYRRENKLLP